MSDKTSQFEAPSTLLDHEARGIYAPVRLLQPIPRTRYGWRAAIIVLAHALLLAVFLLRLDFLSGGTVPSKPETLDIIVVDLSGESNTPPPVEPVADASDTRPPQATPPLPQAESQSVQVSHAMTLTPVTEPAVENLPATEADIVTTPSEASARPEPSAPASTPTTKAEPPSPPAPVSKPIAATASRNISATPSSATNNTPLQSTTGLNKESESQTTPPRLDPAYLHNPAPNYPALSRRNRESGTVLLLVRVDPDGNATAVTLHQSSGHERLDQAAVQAVTRWRFVPGMRGQTAISATVIVPISFKQP